MSETLNVYMVVNLTINDRDEYRTYEKVICPKTFNLLWARGPILWEKVGYIYIFVHAKYEPDRPYIYFIK